MHNSILYSEINAVCILILALLSIKVKKSMFLQQHRNLFFREMVTNILFLALDAVWIFIDNSVFGVSVAMNWALNCTYYILSGFLGYFWFAFSETVQESSLVSVKKYKIISKLPIAVLVALTLASVKTGWLFYVDAQNVYHRGPLYFVQLLTAYGYIIFTAAKAFYLSFKTEDYRRKSDLKILAVFVLPTLVAGTLQVLFPGYPVLCIGNTVGILYVYLTLQEQLISLDTLTKLNNRNQLYQYLSGKLAHPRDDKKLYLLMLDIDYFKSINDKYGHLEGDNALKKVAGCLMRVGSSKNYFIARFGGDEFVVICELEPTESIDTVCKSIKDKMKEVKTPYELSVSIGCAKYMPGIKNQQEFIEKADAELYKIKKGRPQK